MSEDGKKISKINGARPKPPAVTWEKIHGSNFAVVHRLPLENGFLVMTHCQGQTSTCFQPNVKLCPTIASGVGVELKTIKDEPIGHM